jgi:hypothetical protein
MRFEIGLTFLLVATAGCGGKVVFEGSGGAGGGSSTSSTSTSGTSSSSTTSTGTGGSCAALEAALSQAAADAQFCNPALNMQQCDGAAILNDTCGCPSLLLNETQPAKVAAAKAAYNAWISAKCGPLACGKACFPAGPGFCQPGTAGGGTCVSGLAD